MPVSETAGTAVGHTLPDSNPASGTRIDSPHVCEAISTAGVPPRQGDDSDAPRDSDAAGQQLRTQAAQLAEHLRAREKELDHREAALNARAAQMESEERAWRLRLSERMAELAQNEKTPEPGDASLEGQSKGTVPFSGRRFAPVPENRDSPQQRTAAEDCRLRQELEEQRRAIERRSEQLDRSQIALEQTREELGRLHRETLEFRLATEELWLRLSTAAPAAELIHSLGQIRGKLAEHYRLANAELQEKKAELERLRDELAREHGKLARKKRQFDRWVATCREEVSQQADRLTARQRELERRLTLSDAGCGTGSSSPGRRESARR
jgi:hypothetical protein